MHPDEEEGWSHGVGQRGVDMMCDTERPQQQIRQSPHSHVVDKNQEEYLGSK